LICVVCTQPATEANFVYYYRSNVQLVYGVLILVVSLILLLAPSIIRPQRWQFLFICLFLFPVLIKLINGFG